jgi:hypothetical protein
MKLMIKYFFGVVLISINIINILYCITWEPGFENITSHFHKSSADDTNTFFDTTRIMNYRAHEWTIVI